MPLSTQTLNANGDSNQFAVSPTPYNGAFASIIIRGLVGGTLALKKVHDSGNAVPVMNNDMQSAVVFDAANGSNQGTWVNIGGGCSLVFTLTGQTDPASNNVTIEVNA